MMGLLEGYYVPLYKFHYSPVGHDEKVREGGGEGERGGGRGEGVCERAGKKRERGGEGVCVSVDVSLLESL